MAGIVPNTGLLQDASLLRTDSANWTLHLYKNNFTPISTSVPGDFTESAFTGYSALSPPVFNAPVIVGGNADLALNPGWTTVNTLASPGENVYGYWIDDVAGNVLAAEKFAGGPYDMSILGAQLTLNLDYLVGSM